MRSTHWVLLVAGVLLAAQPALATYGHHHPPKDDDRCIIDLRGYAGKKDSLQFDYDGGTMVATAGYNVDNPAKIYQGGWGLGVYNGNSDSLWLDGYDKRNDIIYLTFEAPVKLLKIAFLGNDSNDDFDFWVDGVQVLNEVDIPGSSFYSVWNVPEEYQMGTVFGIEADGKKDNFKIKKVEHECGDVPIPEPATMLTGALACAALAYGTKRRR